MFLELALLCPQIKVGTQKSSNTEHPYEADHRYLFSTLATTLHICIPSPTLSTQGYSKLLKRFSEGKACITRLYGCPQFTIPEMKYFLTTHVD
jgi:hypothetical protein